MPVPAAEDLDALRVLQTSCADSLKTLEYHLLPSSAQELARAIGLPAALAMVDFFGGLTLRIPHGHTVQGRALLAEISRRVGEAAAQALACKYAATDLYIPNCKVALQKARDAALLADRKALADTGLSERRIVQYLALRYRLAERTVWRAFKRPVPPAPLCQRQASLL